MGATLMGWVWGKCYTGYLKAINASGSEWQRILMIVSPWMFVAEIPFIMAAGPEAYRVLIVEALLLPTLVLSIAARCYKAQRSRSPKQVGFKRQVRLWAGGLGILHP